MPPTGEDALDRARRHVAEAERLVAEQAARVDQLRNHGHDAVEAEKLLETFEQTPHTTREHLQFEENNRSGNAATE